MYRGDERGESGEIFTPGSKSGPTAATAALTRRPHAARVALALDACAHSGEFISANAREQAVLTCRLNPGPESCATIPVNETQLKSV